MVRFAVGILGIGLAPFALHGVAQAQEVELYGDNLCPCLGASDSIKINVTANSSEFDPGLDYDTYGIGCRFHDMNSTACLNDNGRICGAAGISTGIPVPENDCKRTWCSRRWCYVDAEACKLLHKKSTMLDSKTRFYSYATCGQMDSFTDTERTNALQGKVLRVGYNSNTGGWGGAYHPDGSFATTNEWYGPTVNFVSQAALRGGFKINITRPPLWLAPLSKEFFNSTSKFDLCIYATTLGYLDLCVAEYSITDKRASSASFFQLQNKPLFMVTFVAKRSSLSSFTDQFMGIFQPFTTGVWCMILFVVLPLMGLLMVFHEYGAQGSSYPTKSSVMVTDEEGSEDVEFKKIPIWQHIPRALYASLLSFFQGSYEQGIVTLGGKLNLLGISFFILIIITTYTSNLAAILTQDAQNGGVRNIDDAIRAGYTFCATRKTADIIAGLFDIEDRIVVDPQTLGGDGLPGFDCPKCSARTRVFDFMASSNPDQRVYCDAAITTLDGLEEYQRSGEHCNKTAVGGALAYALSGVPMYSGIADPLSSLFVALRNEGVMRRELNDAQPNSKCPVHESEGEALTIEQLTAAWVITFLFALLGLIVKFSHPFLRRVHKKSKGMETERSLVRYDQWGTPVQLEKEDLIERSLKFPEPKPSLRPRGLEEDTSSAGNSDLTYHECCTHQE